jgi:hypothetical protein
MNNNLQTIENNLVVSSFLSEIPQVCNKETFASSTWVPQAPVELSKSNLKPQQIL